MKTAILMLLMLFSSIAFATTEIADWNNLTNEQKAQLQLQAAQLASQNPSGLNIGKNAPTTPEELEKWANFGAAVGKGLAGTAKELGVAADQIADTKVGRFAMIMIAWHYAGSELISIVFGFTWLFFTLPTWLYMYRRQFIIQGVVSSKDADGKPRKEVLFRKYNSDEDTMRMFYWFTLIAIIATGVCPILF